MICGHIFSLYLVSISTGSWYGHGKNGASEGLESNIKIASTNEHFPVSIDHGNGLLLPCASVLNLMLQILSFFQPRIGNVRMPIWKFPGGLSDDGEDIGKSQFGKKYPFPYRDIRPVRVSSQGTQFHKISPPPPPLSFLL